MSTQEQCKLCGQMEPLCRSHIVPNFAYAPIKNEKNQIYEVGHKVTKVQTGYFEKMLCSKCEQLLSGYESKFKQVWMDTIPRDFKHLSTRPLKDIIRVEVPDYDNFKLFHLSVFWRAAVSSGFKVDADISLGKYEKQIAALILNGDPGQPGYFPFFGVLSIDDNKRPVAINTLLAQGKGRFESHHYYLMSYVYCDWIFIVACPGPAWMTALEIKCRNENMFPLLVVPYKQSKSFNLSVDILRNLKQ